MSAIEAPALNRDTAIALFRWLKALARERFREMDATREKRPASWAQFSGGEGAGAALYAAAHDILEAAGVDIREADDGETDRALAAIDRALRP